MSASAMAVNTSYDMTCHGVRGWRLLLLRRWHYYGPASLRAATITRYVTMKSGHHTLPILLRLYARRDASDVTLLLLVTSWLMVTRWLAIAIIILPGCGCCWRWLLVYCRHWRDIGVNVVIRATYVMARWLVTPHYAINTASATL